MCIPLQTFDIMGRHTSTFASGTHRALKGAAARENRPMALIIEGNLELRGVQRNETVRRIIAEARTQSGLNPRQAMTLALEETRRFREGG